jgi:hypothetical protein
MEAAIGRLAGVPGAMGGRVASKLIIARLVLRGNIIFSFQLCGN